MVYMPNVNFKSLYEGVKGIPVERPISRDQEPERPYGKGERASLR